MEKFAGTKKITLKNNHTWVYPVYVLDARLQGNIAGLPKWDPSLYAGVYLDHAQFYSGSVYHLLNPSDGCVSPKFRVVFYDEFSAVPFMRIGTITPNCTDIVQRISQIGSPENIYLKNTWFTPDLDKYLRRTPSHELSITPENNNQTQS